MPIQNKRWCPTHEAIVPYEETVRGFEVSKLLRVITAKTQGEAVAASEAPKPAKVVDLMDALRRSLALARKARPQPVRREAPRPRAAAMRERHRED